MDVFVWMSKKLVKYIGQEKSGSTRDLFRATLIFAGIIFSPMVSAEETVFYDVASGRALAPLDRFRECDIYPEIIVMPLGSFMMGAIEGESRNPFDIYGEDAGMRVRAPDEVDFSRAATENLRREPMPNLTNRRMPVEVDELDAANAWGVRHMSGNVAELTLSCWTDAHLRLATDSAYLADAQSRNSCIRVAKGGSFTTAMDYLRPAARGRPMESSSTYFLGFRIIRELTRREVS